MFVWVRTLQHDLEAISLLRGRSQIERHFHKVCGRFGFDHFSVLSLTPLAETSLPSLLLSSNWPKKLADSIEAEFLRNTHETFVALRRSAVPLMVSQSEQSTGNQNQRESGESGAHPDSWLGRFSVLYPVLSRENHRCVVGFHSLNSAIDPGSLSELYVLASGLIERLWEGLGTSERQLPELTIREVECLRWTAAGKTSHEIATILSISQHTVNHYIAAASKKLDTVNRIQAVACAIRLGIIT